MLRGEPLSTGEAQGLLIGQMAKTMSWNAWSSVPVTVYLSHSLSHDPNFCQTVFQPKFVAYRGLAQVVKFIEFFRGRPKRATTLLHFSKCSRPFIQTVKSTLSHLKSCIAEGKIRSILREVLPNIVALERSSTNRAIILLWLSVPNAQISKRCIFRPLHKQIACCSVDLPSIAGNGRGL